jgi:hypothetical protein
MYDRDNPSWYFDLPLDFYNGKRHYREQVSIEVDEAGENLIRYNLDKHENDFIPLTDEKKYSLIIGRIHGSGGKLVMYKHLQSLAPKGETAKAAPAKDITINGEAAEVIRNKEAMRLQLIFTDKPEPETRSILKSNGFRWAPSNTAWQRLLNGNSEYALDRITDKA